jgi:hypothetical protein
MHEHPLYIPNSVLWIDRGGMLDMHNLASYQENTKTTLPLSISRIQRSSDAFRNASSHCSADLGDRCLGSEGWVRCAVGLGAMTLHLVDLK